MEFALGWIRLKAERAESKDRRTVRQLAGDNVDVVWIFSSVCENIVCVCVYMFSTEMKVCVCAVAREDGALLAPVREQEKREEDGPLQVYLFCSLGRLVRVAASLRHLNQARM